MNCDSIYVRSYLKPKSLRFINIPYFQMKYLVCVTHSAWQQESSTLTEVHEYLRTYLDSTGRGSFTSQKVFVPKTLLVNWNTGVSALCTLSPAVRTLSSVLHGSCLWWIMELLKIKM